jgi:hypothetical protein
MLHASHVCRTNVCVATLSIASLHTWLSMRPLHLPTHVFAQEAEKRADFLENKLPAGVVEAYEFHVRLVQVGRHLTAGWPATHAEVALVSATSAGLPWH